MREIIKPEKFEEFAFEAKTLADKIIELQKQRRKILEEIAYLFTDWRVGHFIDLSINKQKAEKYLIFDMRLYSEHHLKEPIYDKQYVVEAVILLNKDKDGKKAKFETEKFMLLSNGQIEDNRIKLVKRNDNLSQKT